MQPEITTAQREKRHLDARRTAYLAMSYDDLEQAYVNLVQYLERKFQVSGTDKSTDGTEYNHRDWELANEKYMMLEEIMKQRVPIYQDNNYRFNFLIEKALSFS